MKLSAQTVVGFIVGAFVAAGVVILLLPSTPSLTFKSFRINGDPLRSLDATPNFARLTFSFSNPTGSAIQIQPQITTTDNSQILTPRDLIVPLTRGVTLSGSRKYCCEKKKKNLLPGFQFTPIKIYPSPPAPAQ